MQVHKDAYADKSYTPAPAPTKAKANGINQYHNGTLQLAAVAAVRLYRQHLTPLPISQASKLLYRITIIGPQIKIHFIRHWLQQRPDIILTLRFTVKKIAYLAAELIVQRISKHSA